MFIFTRQFATAGQSKSLLNNPQGAFFINKRESLAAHDVLWQPMFPNMRSVYQTCLFIIAYKFYQETV